MTDRPQPLTLAAVGPAVVTAFAKHRMAELELSRLDNGKWPTADTVERAIRTYRNEHPPTIPVAWKEARVQLKGWSGASVVFVIERR